MFLEAFIKTIRFFVMIIHFINAVNFARLGISQINKNNVPWGTLSLGISGVSAFFFLYNCARIIMEYLA